MTLTLYGIPISSSFFLTSEQQNFRQSIDNFRFYLDVAALKRTALEKATVVVKSMIPAKLLKIKDDLTKSTDILNTSLLKNTSLRDQAQVEYDKAKKQFADSASLTNQDLLQKAKLKLDTAIAKVEEIKAKLQLIKTRLEQADAAIEKAKSLAESPNLLKSGEEKAKGMAMSKFGRFLSIFTTLEIGKCRPNYSELTLKGIAVSGVNIEMNPGLFYAAFSMGKVKRAVEPQENSTPAYKQDPFIY